MAEQKKQNEYILETSDQARETSSISSATVVTALASFIALIFSGISLYQTVLKRAEVRVFVPETVSYTRDPNGSYEVLAVPVTVINSGARDGVVVAMQLKIKNQESGYERILNASYVAEEGYFSTKEDYRAGISRPKRPFAPLTIPGRSGHSATVLFYPIPSVRYIPVHLASGLARLTTRNRLWAVVYVVFTFIVVPLMGMLIFKD